MNNAEFENKMFHHVNENCRMKELDRQEVARAAAEEYRVIRKCKKVNAIIGIVICTACFLTFTFSMCLRSWLGNIPADFAVVCSAAFGLVSGLSINSLANRIKK